MKFRCKICDWSGELPENATKLMGSSRTSVLYRFEDGSVHDLKPDKTLQKHKRYHGRRQNKNGDWVTHTDPFCEYCHPELLETKQPQAVPVESTTVVESDPVAVFLDEEPIGVPIAIEKIKQESPAEAPQESFRDTSISYASKQFKNKETNKNGR